MLRRLIVIALLAGAGQALAQGTPAQSVAPGDAGSQPPGGLSPRDVTGKYLLDANGKHLGTIQSATAETAIVRSPDGHKIEVEMSRLSLGNGPNTVIEAGNSDADRLNQIQSGNEKRR
jgi:hypothetical protein